MISGLWGVRDLQIIGYFESTGNTTSANVGDVPIPFIVYDSFKSHVSILHDNPDWLLHSQRVFLQHRITVNGTVELTPNSIIIRRGWQNLNLVINVLDSFNSFDHIFGIGFQGRPSNLSHQRDVVPIYLIGEIIKYAEIWSIMSSCLTSLVILAEVSAEGC